MGGFFNPKSLLIYDSARAHLTNDVKNTVSKYSKLAVIPGGLTKKPQPLDLSVKRSFKSKMRRCWEQWMITGKYEYTKTEEIKRASYLEVCNWIVHSWPEDSAYCILDGFRKSGIVNAITDDLNSNHDYSNTDIDENYDFYDESTEISEEFVDSLECFCTFEDDNLDRFQNI